MHTNRERGGLGSFEKRFSSNGVRTLVDILLRQLRMSRFERDDVL